MLYTEQFEMTFSVDRTSPHELEKVLKTLKGLKKSLKGQKFAHSESGLIEAEYEFDLSANELVIVIDTLCPTDIQHAIELVQARLTRARRLSEKKAKIARPRKLPKPYLWLNPEYKIPLIKNARSHSKAMTSILDAKKIVEGLMELTNAQEQGALFVEGLGGNFQAFVNSVTIKGLGQMKYVH